ncbi:MAG: hypothetical protein JOY71_18745 [Acetobacteraceae bacterium]|nr:hypothetical protein [Acetobacteraceae bacterium]
MSDVRLLEPIELTDADLDAVCGAQGAYPVPQFGGQVQLGGGSGPTAYTGKITVNSITANITFAEDRSGHYGVVDNGTASTNPPVPKPPPALPSSRR